MRRFGRLRKIMVVSTILVIASVGNVSCGDRKLPSQKLVMPGTHRIRLEANTEYWIWVFAKFGAQKLDLQNGVPSVTIVTEHGDRPSVRLQSFTDVIKFVGDDREGSRMWRFRTDRAGVYVVNDSAKTGRYVLLIAPKSSHYQSPGSDIVCDEMFDDLVQTGH